MGKSFILPILLAFAILFTGVSEAKYSKHVPGEVVVKLKKSSKRFNARNFLADIYNVEVLDQFKAIDAYLVRTPDESKSSENIINLMSRDANILYAEPNYIYKISALPNDPDFKELYGLKNAGQTGGKIGADIHAEKAWDINKGSKKVVVAVIDTGIDYSHPDLKDNMWKNPGETGTDQAGKDKASNGVDDDKNGFIDDVYGWDFANEDKDPMDDNKHGTHCSGTIGGVGNNGVGVAGVNWYVSLMAVKFLTGQGSGTLAGAVKSIEYAANNGATIMSNSWGGGGFSQALLDIINYSKQKGSLFVAAAGNAGSDNDLKPNFPSNYEVDNVVAVAATDHEDKIANFSCFGKTMVDLAAPGVNIYSTIPGGGYAKLSGTSMATPHVSGVAALIKAQFPNATYADLKGRLLGGVTKITALQEKMVTGGRLNAENSLDVDTVAPGKISDLKITKSELTSVILSWTATGDDGNTGAASAYDIRFSKTPILSNEDWSKATSAGVSPIPSLPGQVDSQAVKGLEFNTKYYFALKVLDNVNNLSELSNIADGKTSQVEELFADTMENGLANWTLTGTWAVTKEQFKSGEYSLTDSPAEEYKSNTEFSATSKPLKVDPSRTVLLSFWHKYDIEMRYDWGYVEISADNGTTWTRLNKYNGANDWNYEVIDLSSHLNGSGNILVRFRLFADRSVSKDGWYIDDVKLVTSGEEE